MSINYQDFKNKYNGKPLDFDGYYGYQCMDLYQQYNKEVIGGKHIPADPAHKVWTNDLYPKDLYTKITNSPTNVPQKGDVIVWGPKANGGFGHIAVFDNGNVNTFVSFDQNWPVGSFCHLQNHNYNYILGWLHPKQIPIDKLIPSSQILSILNGASSENEKLLKIRSLC